MKRFCIFIISHGRPDNIHTLRSLEKANYQGDWYIVCDDQDETINKYIENFGDRVQIFEKQIIANKTDQGDNFNNLRTTTHCRNACYDIAEYLGYNYFLVLDDDYTQFRWRFTDEYKFTCKDYVTDIDDVLNIVLDYYISIPNLLSICFGQGGDFIGGGGSTLGRSVCTKRKAMNSFFSSTKRRFKFIGRLNEDVNTYVRHAVTGGLFLTFGQVALEQVQTQASSGGMTEAYLDSGTYVKSFYTVMFHPSGVKINTMSGRIHHSIKWKNTTPMIIREQWRK
jgi:hypothetical protein